VIKRAKIRPATKPDSHRITWSALVGFVGVYGPSIMLDLIVFGFVTGKRVVEFVVVKLLFTSLNITTL
jgi:hypothetical protein